MTSMNAALLRLPFALLLAAPLALAQQTTRVSIGPAGTQGNFDSYGVTLSVDGRFVAFQSDADNLVALDTNGQDDIFVRDRATNTTVLVSLDSSGNQANSGSFEPSISADGRYVVFNSLASNLVALDTNGGHDVFVRDLLTGTTVRASVDSAGSQANGACYGGAISADGRYVTFESSATNLVPGDTNAANDIFVHDLQTGTTVRVSVDSAGAQGTRASTTARPSADGRCVVFTSQSKLVPLDTDNLLDIYVRDLVAGTTVLASVDSSGVKGLGASTNPAISGDGRFVSFVSGAANLVPGDTNGTYDIFVHDLSSGVTVAASVTPSGAIGNGYCTKSALSGDGRYVAFKSYADDLVAGDDNDSYDIFVRDLISGHTLLASASSTGIPGNDYSSQPAISADGRHVGYYSAATNLVRGDTNGAWDVFVWSLGKIRHR